MPSERLVLSARGDGRSIGILGKDPRIGTMSDEALSLKPGDRVEHFTILSPLGEGGMGQVYLARDDRLNRDVALKIVHPSDADRAPGEGSGGAARLLREAQSAAALTHPNVVTIFEVGEILRPGETHRRPFIAMELVRGRSLRTFVGSTTVPMTTRIRWLADVGRALAAAHVAGLVHRDVKPENVMVREDGVIKVLDFGIAKRAAVPVLSSTSTTEAQVLPSITAKGVAVGTPYYMAPEQMRREPLDGRADQFSWGVVAYELLAGVSPWGRDVDALELVSKLLADDPPPLSEIRPDVPPHVSLVVARAMSKKRGARYPSMDALLDELERQPGALAPTQLSPSVPSGASHAAPTPGSARLPRRRRTAAIGAAALLLVAGVSAFVFGRRSPQPVTPAVVVNAPPECTGSSQCVAKNGGSPAVCHEGKCALIENDACHASYEPGDLQRDDTVWVGAMFPLSGDDAKSGQANRNAVELGRRDFAQASASLRGPDGSAPVHPLALVACDDSTGVESVTEHLTRDIGVPAVIGFGDPRSTVKLVSSVFVPRNVLSVVTISLDPMLARVPHAAGQPRMVWRTTYDNSETAEALAALVAHFEPGVGKGVRVAVVRAKAPAFAAFAERLFAILRFNGKSALENGTDYLEASFTDVAELPAIAAEVAHFQPTFVVSTDNDVFAMIEDAWPKSARRPCYLSNANFDTDLLAFVRRDLRLRRRVFAMTSVSNTLSNARFTQHYNETFAEPITRAWAPNSSYDAWYLVGYATYAFGLKPVSGRTLAESVARLVPPGDPLDVGTTGILQAFADLAGGRNIDLNGSTGALDFDFKTGNAPVDLAVLCADRAGREGIESGLVFDAKGNRLSGGLRCD
jgi:serine/threonine-protein kinase